MNFVNHPKRYLLDIAVGVVLISMLVFGSVGIYQLNNDARDLNFNSALAMKGQQYSTDLGCVACHTVDGSPGVGPTWVNMWGRTEKVNRDRTIVVDEAYFEESLKNPGAKVVEGFPNVMTPYYWITDDELSSLIDYVKQLDHEP
jgi:cytochrome c oxidase subunit 2